MLTGGVNDNVSGTLFDTLAAAGTLFVIDTNAFILHGEGIFWAVFNAAVALDTPHLADLSNNLALFIGVTANKNPPLTGDEGDYLFWANPNAVAAPRASFPVHLWGFPARSGKGSKGTDGNAVAKTQTAVSAERITTTVQ